MTPDEVRKARERLGLTQTRLGEILELQGDSKGDTVRKWENGRRPISGPARVAIRLLLERAGMGPAFPPLEPVSAIIEPQLKDPASEAARRGANSANR
jgi:transcriptional regulator with XRE-family HTH domain